MKSVDESILFSLGFLSQNSIWKLSIFRGYKGLYIVGCVWNAKSQFCNKQDVLATWPGDLTELQVRVAS